MTKSRSASQASWPPTVARPRPVPARADRRPSVTSRSRTSPGHHLAAEAGLVDAAEERELAGEALVGEHRDPPELGQGLDHQHPGQGGAAREVPGEEGLVTAQVPAAPGALSRLELGDLVHQEERGPVGQDVLGSQHGRRGYRSDGSPESGPPYGNPLRVPDPGRRRRAVATTHAPASTVKDAKPHCEVPGFR